MSASLFKVLEIALCNIMSEVAYSDHFVATMLLAKSVVMDKTLSRQMSYSLNFSLPKLQMLSAV